MTVTLTPRLRTDGYPRVFRGGRRGIEREGVHVCEQVGESSNLPHVKGEVTPPPPGTSSIHNTEVRGERACSAWFSDGIVAHDLSDPTRPVEVGQFVPETSSRYAGGLSVGPANVWGVAIDPETGTIYVSDMRSGLWVVQPTGPER